MKNKIDYNKLLDFPEYLKFGSSRITISNDTEVLIEGKMHINLYSENEVVIELKNKKVSIFGSGLQISMIGENLIEITGKINSLEF